jgi:hypothetical protein
MSDPKFLEANAAKLIQRAMNRPPIYKALCEMVEMMESGDAFGRGSPWYMKAKEALLAEPDTDWHAEALMYSEALGKVKDFCDITHECFNWNHGQREQVDCGCIECQLKRRILAIIARGLK